jgi:hypothetical protein
MSHQTDAALLVELTVTKRRKQFVSVLQCLKSRGWNIVSTPRDHGFGIDSDTKTDVSDPENSQHRGLPPAAVRAD